MGIFSLFLNKHQVFTKTVDEDMICISIGLLLCSGNTFGCLDFTCDYRFKRGTNRQIETCIKKTPCRCKLFECNSHARCGISHRNHRENRLPQDTSDFHPKWFCVHWEKRDQTHWSWIGCSSCWELFSLRFSSLWQVL